MSPADEERFSRLVAEVAGAGRVPLMRECVQHGQVSTWEHCVRVAHASLAMARALRLRVSERELVRSALLHDYFLYDWHDWDNGEHQWHGFTHGHAALVNALKDFKLNDIERNSIENHMFPMTPVPPRYIEGYLVTLADKCSATAETFSFDRFNKRALPAAKPYAEIEARR